MTDLQTDPNIKTSLAERSGRKWVGGSVLLSVRGTKRREIVTSVTG